jgi:hypothetical protein
MVDELAKSQAARRRALDQKRETDLDLLRSVAWCVQRMRYSAEPLRIEGGRRGKARIATITFYLEAADLNEARDAVREIMARRDASDSSRGPTTGSDSSQ